MSFYDKLAAQVPPSLVEVLRIPDVGPKKTQMMWQKLGLTTVDEVKAAATAGRLRSLPGFGAKSEAKILAGIDERHLILDKLLLAESQMVRHALKAGLRIGAYKRAKRATPSAAVAALAAFASILTEAFHASITPLLGAGLRALGTRIFLDVSRAIDRDLAGGLAEANAMLSLEFLMPGAPFDEASLLKAGMVRPDLLAVADRVIQSG